jgi:hypothetical protein
MRVFRKRCDRCREQPIFNVFDLQSLQPRSLCLRHMQDFLFTLDHPEWLIVRKLVKKPAAGVDRERGKT